MQHNIVIIGAGPRGTYALRRLALALAEADLKHPVNIHVIEGSGNFGGGRVHAPDQPEYLLLNTVASQITALGDDDHEARQAPQRRSLHGFLKHRCLAIGPNDYPSRAQHGQYLASIFDWTEAHLPPGVTLQRRHATVERIQPDNPPVVVLDDGASLTADAILMVTGHAKNTITPGSAPEGWNRFASEQRQNGAPVSYIHYVYPIEKQTRNIAPGEHVYVIGMGLTAIDILKTFTTGRGGVFKSDRYIPSGNEPKIILASRIGIPYAARALNQKNDQYMGKILTHAAVEKLKADKGVLDFKQDLFPLVLREMEYVYYSTLIGDWFGEKYLECTNDAERQELIRANVDAKERLRWQDLENPWLEIESKADPNGYWFDSLVDYHRFVLDVIKADVAEAQKGNLTSPLKNAVDSVLRDCRDVLRIAVNFGGLTPESHRVLNREFDRVNNRIAVGPPIKSSQELILAMEAGIAELSGPNPRLEMDADKGLFYIESDQIKNSKRYIQHVINGRIHGVNIKTDSSNLFRGLLEKGAIRPYVNRSDQSAYQPGGLDITADFRIINQDGEAHPCIYAIGIMTEGKIWFNAADARPDVNSTAIGHLAQWAGQVVDGLAQKEAD